MDLEQLYNQAAAFHRGGRLAEAEQLYRQVMAGDPFAFAPRHMLGLLLAQQGRHEQALEELLAALKINPGVPQAQLHCGNVLLELHRPAEALAHFDRALAAQPYEAAALKSRGFALWRLRRYDDALAAYQKALAVNPQDAEGLNDTGNILRHLRRHAEALAQYDQALVIAPGVPELLNNRGITLTEMQRFAEALACFDRALAARPGYVEAMVNRGKALCESGRTGEGFAAFTAAAKMTPAPADTRAHKLVHDAEQAAWAEGRITEPAALHLEGGERLAGPAINPANAAAIAAAWRQADPKLVVIDDLLTPEALAGLRRFCLGSTVWRKVYRDGYLGASPESGFACPLLAQIADEFAATFPDIFDGHPLRYLWAFKYDSRLKGTEIHADEAAVNVNFWITPDDANTDPDSGGLVVWDRAAPLDWDFTRFNADVPAMRQFLAEQGARPVTVPYRANRAVIFDSDLFHETDTIRFRDGYENRRINVTLLYGRRETGGV
jgi:tetratricopeptide (TPR) repeat protein